jgi:rhodanese-related sulfurtransferase
MLNVRPLLIALLTALLFAAGCSSGDTASLEDSAETPARSQEAQSQDGGSAGIRLVSATEGAAIQADPPDDLVVLDVRTPEEFAEGHLDGAIMLDFYQADFEDRLAELDPDVPYLLYCRSGSRSGQTKAVMSELGFTDVADVDGGIVAWSGAGFELVKG